MAEDLDLNGSRNKSTETRVLESESFKSSGFLRKTLNWEEDTLCFCRKDNVSLGDPDLGFPCFAS